MVTCFENFIFQISKQETKKIWITLILEVLTSASSFWWCNFPNSLINMYLQIEKFSQYDTFYSSSIPAKDPSSTRVGTAVNNAAKPAKTMEYFLSKLISTSLYFITWKWNFLGCESRFNIDFKHQEVWFLRRPNQCKTFSDTIPVWY